jgi:hypothetical protein
MQIKNRPEMTTPAICLRRIIANALGHVGAP